MAALKNLTALLGRIFSARGWARPALIFAVMAGVGASTSLATLSAPADQTSPRSTPGSAEARPAATPLAGAQPRFLGNAHCRCEITCHAASGQTFTRNNDPFPGYTQGSESERNRCQSSCNQWVGSSIQSWAEQENICGDVSCSGTSHVGDEPQRKWKNVAGASHHRLCCGPASNGEACQPPVGTVITSMFRLVQSGSIAGNYNLVYDPSLNSAFDPAFQAYANLVGTQLAGLHHIWVVYLIEDVTSTPVTMGWFPVKYTVGGAGGVPGTTTAINPPQLLINHTYLITRGVFFMDAQDHELRHYGDPSCRNPTFTINLSVVVGRAGPQPMARYHVAGQPDRLVAIEPESAAEREQRLRIEREAPRSERPNLPIERLARPRPAAPQR